jgi:hypothetical protein
MKVGAYRITILRPIHFERVVLFTNNNPHLDKMSIKMDKSKLPVLLCRRINTSDYGHTVFVREHHKTENNGSKEIGNTLLF